jgi:hypothetical protein
MALIIHQSGDGMKISRIAATISRYLESKRQEDLKMETR